MKIRGVQITEGLVLTILGAIFVSVVAGLGYTYRGQIAWFRFMMDTQNVFELINRFENTTDPGEKVSIAVKISYHSAQNSLAVIKKVTKDLEKGEIGEVPKIEADPTGREGAVIKKALEYVEWAYSLVDYYSTKIPAEKISALMAPTRAKLSAAGFKDDFTDQELAQAFPSFGKVKPCTVEDFNQVVATVGEDQVMKYASSVFAANLAFSGKLGAESGNAVLREAIKHSENAQHTQVLQAILDIQEMRPPFNDEWAAESFYKKSKDWEQVRELVMPFRRAAPHCFQTKNYSNFLGFHKEAVTAYRAKRLAERLVQHIKSHGGEVPKELREVEFLEYEDRHDGWYSEFKFDRTQTEIVITSIGKDRRAGSEDDFVVHRRDFIFGGE